MRLLSYSSSASDQHADILRANSLSVPRCKCSGSEDQHAIPLYVQRAFPPSFEITIDSVKSNTRTYESQEYVREVTRMTCI